LPIPLVQAPSAIVSASRAPRTTRAARRSRIPVPVRCVVSPRPAPPSIRHRRRRSPFRFAMLSAWRGMRRVHPFSPPTRALAPRLGDLRVFP